MSAIHEETLYTVPPFSRRVSLEKRGKCSEDEQNIYLCSTSFISIWADSHYSGQIRPLVCSCVKKFMESASLPGECNTTLSTASTSGSGTTGMQISTSEAPDRPSVAITYEYTTGLLEQLVLAGGEPWQPQRSAPDRIQPFRSGDGAHAVLQPALLLKPEMPSGPCPPIGRLHLETRRRNACGNTRPSEGRESPFGWLRQLHLDRPF